MATGKITIDEGVTTNTATHTITEDAVTKHIPRSVLNNSSGTEIGTSSNPIQVTLANTGANATAVKVDGSAVTQPVSAASLPLPTGASTAAKQPALGTAGAASADVITVQGIASMTALKVDGSAVTQPVSAASLPLPTGAATAAKQPALGVAGTASADVITVQGVTSMTPLLVDGSGVTQPVSGTITGITNVVHVDDNSGSLTVDGAVTVTGNKAEDAAASDGDAGLPILGVRNDAAAARTSTDGDYGMVALDSAGRVGVCDLGGAVSVDDNGSTLSIDDGAGSITVDGTVSITANSSVNVAQVGGTAADTNSGNKSAGTLRVVIATDQPAFSTAVPVSDNSGSLTVDGTVAATQSGTWSVGHGKTLKSKTGSASATFTIVAAVTSKKIKVYSLSLITAATTAVTVTFKDGAAGTAIATYPLQAITGTNFGITENVAVPSSLFETSAGTLLEMSFSAAQTVTYNLRYWDDDAT